MYMLVNVVVSLATLVAWYFYWGSRKLTSIINKEIINIVPVVDVVFCLLRIVTSTED